MEESTTTLANSPPSVLQDALYFLSPSQAHVVANIPFLQHVTNGGSQLSPDGCYIPHRIIAHAFGKQPHGIDMAIKRYGNYIWMTEFENVHKSWNFDEPGFLYKGIHFKGPEQFYQAHKAGDPSSLAFQMHCRTFASANEDDAFALGGRLPLRQDWNLVKDDVMRTALRLKFGNCEMLKHFLLATHPHPLVSVKSDAYWGTGLDGKGKNRLGFLLMELRADLRADV